MTWLIKNSDQSKSEIGAAELLQLWQQQLGWGYSLDFEAGVAILSHVQDK